MSLGSLGWLGSLDWYGSTIFDFRKAVEESGRTFTPQEESVLMVAREVRESSERHAFWAEATRNQAQAMAERYRLEVEELRLQMTLMVRSSDMKDVRRIGLLCGVVP